MGTLELAELRRLLTAVGELRLVGRCLLALDGHPPQGPQLLGTVDGIPPSAASVLAALPPGPGPHLVASGWIAPVVSRGEVVGAVLADGSPHEGPDRIAAAVAGAVAEVLAASAAEHDESEALRTLVEVSKQLHAAEVDADAVIEFIVERAHEFIGADATWLALADHERQESRVTAVRGARTDQLAAMKVRLGEGITGLALSAGDVVTLHDETHTDDRLPPVIHVCMRAEGIVSMVCAPLFHQGALLGNLLVGFRRVASVPRDAQYLLSALGSQAAITIANSRLYASLREQNDLLRRHSALSGALTEASLAGGGQHSIAAELARAIGRDIVVERQSDSRSAWRYPTDGGRPAEVASPSAVDGSRASAIIRAGGEGLGRVHLADPGEVTDFHRAALNIGATAIALELAKEMAALEAEWRVRGDLLEELLQAGAQWSDSLRQRAQQVGLDIAQPCSVAVIEGLPGAEHAAMIGVCRAAGTADGILVGNRGERVVVAIRQRHRPRQWVQALLDRALDKGIPLVAGVSAAHLELELAHNEAQAALKLAREAGKPATIVDAAALGPLRFMLDAPDTTQMVGLVRSTLGPLADYDHRRQGELLDTLRTFLDVGGNHPVTAERCQVHLNTVKYRLGRAAEILGRQLTDPATRFELSLAYAVWDLLDALGVVPFSEPGE